jgi:hypothetical protein
MKLRFVLAVVLFVASRGVAWPQVPLPTNLLIQPPGADVPAADATFSGAWGNGAWDASAPTALIVEQVDEDGTAKVIYASGTSEHPKTTAQWLRLTGRIADHCLTIHLPDPNSSAGFRIQYRIMARGRLDGDLTTWDGWRTHAFLQRIPGPAAAIIATAAHSDPSGTRSVFRSIHWSAPHRVRRFSLRKRCIAHVCPGGSRR